jgi:acyl-CoA hydrolase
METVSRNIVLSPDIGINGRLFGGKLLSWIDEAAALYAMDIMKTGNIVTKFISNVDFVTPAYLGERVYILCEEEKRGKSSLTINCKVDVTRHDNTKENICNCQLVFVSIDDTGQPIPWNENV